MPVATTCPHCGMEYNLADHLRGKTVRCKKCQSAIVVGEGAARQGKGSAKSSAIAKESGARENRGAKASSPKRNRREDEAKSSPRRQGKRGNNRGLIVGLILGGLVLLLLGGGVVGFLLLSGRFGNRTPDQLVDVGGSWPEPLPFPAMAGPVPPDTFVTIHVANVHDKYTGEEIGDRLRALADNGNGGSTGRSAGDRGTILLKPVKDPQALANKIDFATVHSVKGRTITLIARKVDGPPPEADDVAVGLYRLKSPLSERRSEGAKLLSGSKPDQRRAELLRAPDPRRAEVLRALESVMDDPNPFTRDEVFKALGVWGGKETVPVLVKAMQKEETRRAAIQALGRIKDPSASEALAAYLKNFFHKRAACDALKAIGSPAEETVIKCLGDPEPDVRAQACDILQVIGGPRSIVAMQKLLADKDGRVANAAKQNLDALKKRIGSANDASKR